MTPFSSMRPLGTLGSLFVAAFAVLSAHCSSDGHAAQPEVDDAASLDAASGPTTSDAAADVTSSDGAPFDGAAPDGAAGPSAACVSYCSILSNSCDADYPQFGSTAACLNACAIYPPGTDADPDNAGDTLKCRVTHAMAGSLHCLHGGPYGYGGCGSMCEDFCLIAMTWCAGAKTGAPFPSLAACQSTCDGWAWAPNGPDGVAAYRATTPSSGNTLDCREVQLTKSLASAADRDTYCPWAADDSVPCR